MFLMAGMGVGFCQGIQPDLWQTTTASSVDRYADWECDTVIARTCGHSVTVSCARVPDAQGEAASHRFVLRCMNHGNYFTFDLLPETRDTMGTAFYLYEDKTCYYIRDMRVSDSICFFCGTRVIHRRYLSYSLMKSLPDDEFYYKGFFGRFDMSLILRDSNAMYIPIVPGPGLEPPVPVPVTEWYPRVQFAYIDEAATLDKLWVDNGLYVDGWRLAYYDSCSQSEPYNSLAVYVDSNFSIDEATAYIIGRRADSMERSCLVEVLDNLRYPLTPSSYRVWTPTLLHEVLTDVTGNDCRVLFSSRIFNDIHLEEAGDFRHDYTVGIRYKDMFSNDDDYLCSLHLYSHEAEYPNNPLGDEEYAHLSRLKNYHGLLHNNVEVYYEKDFGIVYTCKEYNSNSYSPPNTKTLVYHIEKNMGVNCAFKVGHMSDGGYLVRDVAYIGNYNMNCLAIAYKHEGTVFTYTPYIELIDWGYWPYCHFQDGFNHSARLYTSSLTTTLDVFLDGHSFLMGGYSYVDHVMDMATQRRSAIRATSEDIKCSPFETKKIYNSSTFHPSYAKIDKGLSFIVLKELSWESLWPLATKYPVVNVCTKISNRENEPTDADTNVEQ